MTSTGFTDTVLTRTRIGDQLFAVAVAEFLGDGERLVRRPGPALATGLLQRRQVEQLRWPLPAMLDLDAELAVKAISRAGYGLGAEAVLDALLCRRSVAHGETAARHMRLRHDLEIVLGPKITDSNSRRQTMPSVGVFTRPMPMTPRAPGAKSVFVAVRVSDS